MDLKKKIVETKNKVKTKIKENPDAAFATGIAIASQVIGFAAVGLAYHLSNKLEEERRNHAVCHGFAHWVVKRAEANDCSEKLIKADPKNKTIHIHDKPETPEED